MLPRSRAEFVIGPTGHLPFCISAHPFYAACVALGHVAIVLHAHLPFVRHPEHRDFLEERWLFEAIAECYLPLLAAFDRLERDGIPFRITVSLSPPLVAMLRDPLLQQRFEAHMGKIDRLLDRELARTATDSSIGPVVHFYAERQRQAWAMWHRIEHDVALAFASLARRGRLEIWTCGATHAFLPALIHHPRIQRAQIQIAVDSHIRALSLRPRGIWLPECGYAPGIDRVLVDHGLAYTALESHALAYASPRPRFATATPVVTTAGLACVGRDTAASAEVWSKTGGYPGHTSYREFYRDVGYDGAEADVREFLAADGTRQHTGLKYYRITHAKGLHAKEPYDPLIARSLAFAHGADFVRKRADQIRGLSFGMPVPPLVFAPYDAELFGHWWFEGPDFIEGVFRAMANAGDVVSPTTIGEYMSEWPTHDLAEPEVSSWGAGGYAGVWLDPGTGWMLRHVDHAAREVVSIVRRHGRDSGVRGRAARQAVREFLLLISSDWAFLIKTDTAPHYARARFETHLARFLRLAAEVDEAIDETWLTGLESRDNLFATLPLDWAWDD